MGVGIAIMQPALPSIVREWVPRDIGLATAVYSNGLLVGEAISASLTIAWMLPLVGQSWRLSLVAWSLPLFAIAALGFWHARGQERRGGAQRPVGSWWPDWRSPLTWRLGIIAGGCSTLYFGTNTFLPDYLRHLGEPDLIGPALSALNWAQMLASFLLLVFSRHLMMRRWPLAAIGVLVTCAVVGLLISSGAWLVFWSGVIGFCCAFLLILTLALPPMLVEASQVHSVSAAVFAIGYLSAVIVPVLGGLAWDLTDIPWTAFAPIGLFGPIIVLMASGLDFSPRPSARDPGRA
jgi:CP family cyanate transporter-like MFS transporter